MKRIFDLLRKAYALRQTRRELYAMSDHMLNDIGLRRDQINGVRVTTCLRVRKNELRP
jgi:uncharacterized protein YjiS (DUF1127 family)